MVSPSVALTDFSTPFELLKLITNIKRISNLNLGVIGAGRIGSSVLLKAKALTFKTFF